MLLCLYYWYSKPIMLIQHFFNFIVSLIKMFNTKTLFRCWDGITSEVHILLMLKLLKFGFETSITVFNGLLFLVHIVFSYQPKNLPFFRFSNRYPPLMFVYIGPWNVRITNCPGFLCIFSSLILFFSKKYNTKSYHFSICYIC